MVLSSTLLLKLLLVTAGPGDVASDTTPPDPVPIVGGDEVNTCGWPSVVYLSGNGFLCSGSLIHPEIIATAAHCIEVMEPNTIARFGDTAFSSQELVEVEYCTSSPDFVSNGDGTIAFSEVQNDWGFCKLAEPVTSVTPIPVAYGCEMDNVVEGATTVRVGFGKLSMANNQFFKRWVETPINTIPFTDEATGWATQLSEGGGGVGTCPGDSGGPSFISVPTEDGGEAWRLLAIQSTQPVEDGEGNEIECGTEPNNTAVFAQGVPFVEEESGIDITPCFDQAGNWDPNFQCQGFPVDPGAGGGTWAMGCDTGPLTGFANTCGSTFPELVPDADAPSVILVEPAEDLVVPFEGDSVEVHVVAEADDGDGWGMAHVELVISDADSGDILGTFDDVEAAYEWDPAFPIGVFIVQAIGYDNAGLITETDTRTIYVGVDPPGAGTGDGGSDGDDDGLDEGTDGGDDDGAEGEGTAADAGAEGTGGDEDDDDDGDGTGIGGGSAGAARGGDDSGCACTASPTSAPAWSWLVLLGLLGLRRRR